ncbi:MAG: pyrimidine 5'-nucleotidase [Qingshengfaniella sp.]
MTDDSDLTTLNGRTTWVFDLDQTLYPPEMALFPQIEARMTAFVADTLTVSEAEASRMRHHYWKNYGTTLAGLMAEHGVEPEPFLRHVHDVSFDMLHRDPALRAAIEALPGRKIIYTNGSGPYAERVLAARGLSGLFAAVYGVEHAQWEPKPLRSAFERIFAMDGLIPETAVMFEDDARNLEVPHAMGLATVHVAPVRQKAPHIHFHTDNLTRFLSTLPSRSKTDQS